MKKSNKSIINFLAFSTLVIVALLIFVENILPFFGLYISGTVFSILRTISNLFILIILGIAAYAFTNGRKKWLKILFWIAVAIFVAATVLIWF